MIIQANTDSNTHIYKQNFQVTPFDSELHVLGYI